jgi:hypothetical protein
MSVGPVNNGPGFAQQGNLPGNEGEPQAPRGDSPRNDRANGNGNNGNGNGGHHGGVHGNEGNGPRTGGNNPASVEGGNQGNQGTQGNHGNHGNRGTQGNNGHHGGSGDYGHSGNMNTGGPAARGLVDVPGVVHQLGNSLFSVANGVQNLLGGDGHAEHRNASGPPAHAHANANTAAGTQAPPAHANANANAHLNPGHEASLRGDARAQMATTLAPPGTNTPQAGVRAEGATPNNAATGTTTLAQTASAVPQQRALGDPALLAQSRPADAAALAQGRTADAALAARPVAAALAAAARNAATTAPAPATTAPPTLANTAMPPPGNTAALAAAGLTVATIAGNPVADARGVILPANDAAALRGEQMLNPAGHTVAGAQRRSLRSRMQGMPQGGMARLLWAMGAMGHTGDAGQAGSEREIQRALQWLFWMLAIIAYGCVAVAIVAFVGSDGRLMDSINDRNYTAWLAVLGLATGVGAWGVARWMSRRR